MKITVQYLITVVKSLEESVKFYGDVLGFREWHHVGFPDGGITIMNSPNRVSVELIEKPWFDIGLYSVGTDVDNLGGVIEHKDE